LSNTSSQISTQVGYGFAELGVSAIESFLRLYLLIYLTASIGMSADMAGYAVSIGIIWDAFADPIMGKISDKTRSKYGPRLPWILAGTPILALTFVFLFDLQKTGSGDHMWTTFLEVTLLNIVLNTAMTMVSVPHLALGNEIVTDPPLNRTSIYAWRSAMTLFGFLIGILIPAAVNAFGISLIAPEFTFAVVIAFVALLSSAITFFSCKKITTWQQDDSHGAPHKIKDVLRGKVGTLMIAFFIATFAQGLNSVLAMYYYRFSLKLDEQAIGKVLIVFIFSLCATLPFWVKAASRFSKHRLIATGTLILGILSAIFYPLFPPQHLAGPYALAVIGGILLGSSGLLESLLVDTAELQNIKNEAMGLVFGIWKFMAKSARGISIAIGGKLLAMSGYSPNATPTETVTSKIALLFGPGVGLFFIMTAMILFLSRENSKASA
jgi:GPH family glycoside/pentoside/hexuronide:cation symporter